MTVTQMDDRPRRQPTVNQEFERWLSEAKLVWLLCRIFGHQWVGDDGVKFGSRRDFSGRRIGGFALQLDCLREADGESCGVGRVAYLNSDFTPDEHTGNRYRYPKGYQLPELVIFTKARRARVRQTIRELSKRG